MRTVLHQFFSPKKDELEKLWSQALICYDASTLLNLYGYSEATASELVQVVKRYADRSRLHHQFATEYARNRVRTILKQVSNFADTEKDFERIEKERLAPKQEHPFLSEKARLALGESEGNSRTTGGR